jgi:hypothetical protein
MTNERRRPRLTVIILAVLAGLFVLSGVVGIVRGDGAAQAGWWIVAVGFIGLAVVVIELARR